MYSFPIVAVTNYHKSGGFKQHKIIFLQHWESESPKQIGLAGLKSRFQQGCAYSGGS